MLILNIIVSDKGEGLVALKRLIRLQLFEPVLSQRNLMFSLYGS